MRRASPRRARIYSAGGIRVNFRTAEATRGGARVVLTALELHHLLQYLVEHRGEIVTRQELLHAVWGHGVLPITRTVDVRIASLRRKLEPELIVTVHGVGYRLVDA